ncbi:MAG: FG-GAP repeat protein [Phycisphaerae bacterium]|nr:FG-GAP repeat protein [Phycisphaerae bacterium]
MGRLLEVPHGYRWVLFSAIAASLGVYLACTASSTPQRVEGPPVTGNMVPLLTIVEPAWNLSIGQGANFSISWSDQDRDSAAMISFSLVNTSPESSPQTVLLVEGIPENDSAASDTITVTTTFVPRGQYYLQGTIADGTSTPITTFATTASPASTKIVVTITEAQATPSNRPPSIHVVKPSFNLSVTLDDAIEILVQPSSSLPVPNIPYDPDDETLLYISLDLDDDPRTGDPLNPDADELIVLLDSPIAIPENSYEQLEPILISVDLARFPIREDGAPYFIRATIVDGVNEPRNAYATGSINVTRVASGRVDLGKVGGTLTGATWLGFDPRARLGTSMVGIGNFDYTPGEGLDDPNRDVVDDCLLVSQFGVPTGRPPIGEAYLIYGLDGRRFGGRINVNTVGTEVDGATFMGPEPRISNETNGITSVGYIPDISGDGRPELLFGCSHTDGIRQHRDDDPSDTQSGDREELVAKIQRNNVEVIPLNPYGEEEEAEFTTRVYEGVIDTVLDLNDPGNLDYNSADFLTWGGEQTDEGFTPTRWPVILFDDLTSLVIPDFYTFRWDEIEIIDATLFINVWSRGSDSDVHTLLRPIYETTTLTTFSGGEAPVEDVQYDKDTVSGSGFKNIVTGENSVDVTDTIQDIFANRHDLFGWIVIPAEGQAVSFDSSDTGATRSRPRLEIHYSRPVQTGSNLDGCYPDLLPNNTSNNILGGEDDIIAGRSNYESLGMVAMVYSENRDTEYLLFGEEAALSARRLRRATTPLALAGQQPNRDTGSNHWAPGQGVAISGSQSRTAGARFQVCMYDVVDDRNLRQGPVRSLFGQRVGFLPDIGNDQRPEIIISAPWNEKDVEDLRSRYPHLSNDEISHIASRPHRGNIVIYHGQDYNAYYEKGSGQLVNSTWPHFNRTTPQGSCSPPIRSRELDIGVEYEFTVIFGENPEDELGDASSAEDFNLDGSPDVLCGAPYADGPMGEDSGTTYIVYMRQDNDDQVIRLANANFPSLRPPMLRIRGDQAGDRIGWAQESVLDINGDRIDDVVLASPYADAGGVPAGDCSVDVGTNGGAGGSNASFNACRTQFGDADLSSDHSCAVFDYNNDRRVDDLDAEVFAGGDCPVDNGIVAVVFGGITLDGDRLVRQIATPDLPGTIFYGTSAGDRAGHDVASAGDFNRDGYGDLLISAPGVQATDDDGRTRVGVVYLIFGGPHLNNKKFNLAEVGTIDLPGIVFLSPYEAGAPNEAPPQYVAGLGDLNNDGFDDISIGNPLADFVDDSLPQQPGSSGTDLTTGRRRDAGEIYMIYGHNIAEYAQ